LSLQWLATHTALDDLRDFGEHTISDFIDCRTIVDQISRLLGIQQDRKASDGMAEMVHLTVACEAILSGLHPAESVLQNHGTA
jgi:hypothetical protein